MGDDSHRLVRPQQIGHFVERLPVGIEIDGVEPALPARKRDAEAAVGVVRRQQDDPDSDLGRCLEHDAVAGMRGRPVWMMQVVELTDRGDARPTHLHEGRSTQRLHAIRVHGVDEPVHRLAPGPEVLGLSGEPLTASPEATLERMTVCVDESGKHRSARMGHRAVASNGDRTEPSVIADADLHASAECSVDPGEFRPQHRTGHAQNSLMSDSMNRRPAAYSSTGMYSSG